MDETVLGGEYRTASVSCLPGETAVGGGEGVTGEDAIVVENTPIEADGSRPEDGELATGWGARGQCHARAADHERLRPLRLALRSRAKRSA